MFSTFANVESYRENVENHRKSELFAWKTVGICMEKKCMCGKSNMEKGGNGCMVSVSGVFVQKRCAELKCGKHVDKIFLCMEKYVENVTKPRKTVILCGF